MKRVNYFVELITFHATGVKVKNSARLAERVFTASFRAFIS